MVNAFLAFKRYKISRNRQIFFILSTHFNVDYVAISNLPNYKECAHKFAAVFRIFFPHSGWSCSLLSPRCPACQSFFAVLSCAHRPDPIHCPSLPLSVHPSRAPLAHAAEKAPWVTHLGRREGGVGRRCGVARTTRGRVVAA